MGQEKTAKRTQGVYKCSQLEARHELLELLLGGLFLDLQLSMLRLHAL